MTNNRVLFVDDEPHVLEGLRRNLRKDFAVHTVTSGQDAIALMRESKEPFAVIVSDMRMPGMDGVQFLSQAKQIAPDSVRLMLTGNADQDTAVKAVNAGEIFKFLNKPCERSELETALAQAVRQFELLSVEKELMVKTVKGSIEVMAEVLALAKPLAFGRVKRVRALCQKIRQAMGLPHSWELDSAALLSQLGCISLPESLLEKVGRGARLQAREMEEFMSHPQKGFELINKIPRLGRVATIVAYQHKNYDGSGTPQDGLKGEGIPLAARILRAVLEFDEKKCAGATDKQALEHLRRQREFFDPRVLEALAACLSKAEEDVLLNVGVGELIDGMVLVEDVASDKGVLIACRGLEVTQTVREHLRNWQHKGGLDRKLLVRIPKGTRIDLLTTH